MSAVAATRHSWTDADSARHGAKAREFDGYGTAGAGFIDPLAREAVVQGCPTGRRARQTRRLSGERTFPFTFRLYLGKLSQNITWLVRKAT